MMVTRGESPGYEPDRYPDADEHPAAERPPVILLVDDDRGIREAMRMVLADHGIECLTATDGADALAFLRHCGSPPDLIIMDVMMPVMNGWEFRVAQLAEPALRRIPTVALTAASDAVSRAAELGIRDTLRKPIDLDDVFAVIQRYLPHWQPEQ